MYNQWFIGVLNLNRCHSVYIRHHSGRIYCNVFITDVHIAMKINVGCTSCWDKMYDERVVI